MRQYPTDSVCRLSGASRSAVGGVAVRTQFVFGNGPGFGSVATEKRLAVIRRRAARAEAEAGASRTAVPSPRPRPRRRRTD